MNDVVKIYCVYVDGVLVRTFDSLENAELYVDGAPYMTIVEKVSE